MGPPGPAAKIHTPRAPAPPRPRPPATVQPPATAPQVRPQPANQESLAGIPPPALPPDVIKSWEQAGGSLGWMCWGGKARLIDFFTSGHYAGGPGKVPGF